MPVTNPAAQPEKKETGIARNQGQPFVTRTANTTPPSGKVPSTDRSGKSSIL